MQPLVQVGQKDAAGLQFQPVAPGFEAGGVELQREARGGLLQAAVRVERHLAAAGLGDLGVHVGLGGERDVDGLRRAAGHVQADGHAVGGGVLEEEHRVAVGDEERGLRAVPRQAGHRVAPRGDDLVLEGVLAADVEGVVDLEGGERVVHVGLGGERDRFATVTFPVVDGQGEGVIAFVYDELQLLHPVIGRKYAIGLPASDIQGYLFGERVVHVGLSGDWDEPGLGGRVPHLKELFLADGRGDVELRARAARAFAAHEGEAALSGVDVVDQPLAVEEVVLHQLCAGGVVVGGRVGHGRVDKDGGVLAGVALVALGALGASLALWPLWPLRAGVAGVALVTLGALRALWAHLALGPLRALCAGRAVLSVLAGVALVTLVSFGALGALRAGGELDVGDGLRAGLGLGGRRGVHLRHRRQRPRLRPHHRRVPAGELELETRARGVGHHGDVVVSVVVRRDLRVLHAEDAAHGAAVRADETLGRLRQRGDHLLPEDDGVARGAGGNGGAVELQAHALGAGGAEELDGVVEDLGEPAVLAELVAVELGADDEEGAVAVGAGLGFVVGVEAQAAEEAVEDGGGRVGRDADVAQVGLALGLGADLRGGDGVGVVGARGVGVEGALGGLPEGFVGVGAGLGLLGDGLAELLGEGFGDGGGGGEAGAWGEAEGAVGAEAALAGGGLEGEEEADLVAAVVAVGVPDGGEGAVGGVVGAGLGVPLVGGHAGGLPAEGDGGAVEAGEGRAALRGAADEAEGLAVEGADAEGERAGELGVPGDGEGGVGGGLGHGGPF